MHFTGEITLGNVISTFGFLCAALYAWRDLSWRVLNLESWREGHEHSNAQTMENITLLRAAVVKIEALASGQDRRLQLLEDRPESHSHRSERLT